MYSMIPGIVETLLMSDSSSALPDVVPQSQKGHYAPERNSSTSGKEVNGEGQKEVVEDFAFGLSWLSHGSRAMRTAVIGNPTNSIAPAFSNSKKSRTWIWIAVALLLLLSMGIGVGLGVGLTQSQ